MQLSFTIQTSVEWMRLIYATSRAMFWKFILNNRHGHRWCKPYYFAKCGESLAESFTFVESLPFSDAVMQEICKNLVCKTKVWCPWTKQGKSQLHLLSSPRVHGIRRDSYSCSTLFMSVLSIRIFLKNHRLFHVMHVKSCKISNT